MTFYTNSTPQLTSNILLSHKALSNATKVASLKGYVWAYFLLLLFEGALRKWFLPGLATPLLIARDPIAIFLLLKAWQRGLLSVSLNMIGMMVIGFISLFTAFYFGHGNLYVALYGSRLFLIHFPLIFIIGKVLDRDDVIKIGKFTLLIAIPMAVLIVIQFYSPQSAWINRGVGGDIKGAGFGGALGYFRPPGTFSFTNGVSLFFSFTAAFLFYFWNQPRGINRAVLIGATVSVLAAIPFSISRGLFFSVIVSLLFFVFATLRKPRYIGKILLAVLSSILILFFLSKNESFKEGIKVFTARFEDANKQEGGLEGVLIGRYLGGMINALEHDTDQPFFGKGTGMGTNVGSMLLAGKTEFLIAEEEWSRLIGELGFVLGVLVIFIRLRFSIKLFYHAYRHLKKENLLPWMLLSFALLSIPQSPWAQPTSLGFSIMIGGLVLASLRENIQKI